MKTTLLTTVALIGISLAGAASTALAQEYIIIEGGYDGQVYYQGGYDQGGYGGGQLMMQGGYGGGMYQQGPIVQGGYSGNYPNGGFPNQGYGHPGGMQFQQQDYYHSHQSAGVQYERPRAALAGAILQGIGAGLQAADPQANQAAGNILRGIGNGLMAGSGPSVWQNQSIIQGSQGSMGFFGNGW